MKFSLLEYERPDYEALTNRLVALKKRMEAAASYEALRDAWLAVKREIEYAEYREEIAYIRHLCGIDYEASTREVELQNAEDPAIDALRDACSRLALASPFASRLEEEFGKQVFARMAEGAVGGESESLKLQTTEARLKTEYRRLMKSRDRDEEMLFDVFLRLIGTRRDLAAARGFASYVDLGYRLRDRRDYGREELSGFRERIRKTVVPALWELKKRGIGLKEFPAKPRKSGELIAAVRTMFSDLSGETGAYIEEMVRDEMFDLESRENKRPDLWTCCMLPCLRLPFVIGDYHGGGMETAAAVHEFGHGFAFRTAAQTQPLYEYHRSSPAVNEIHSKTMEHFMYPYLELFVDGRRRDFIRDHLLQELENLAYRCAVDEFEHSVYELPGLTRTQVCELWADISRKYRPWIGIGAEEIRSGKSWPRQTHVVEAPFYYIEYDIAQIGAWEFRLRMETDPREAWEDYLALCRAGGSRSFGELLAAAQLSDPFGEGTVERICGPAAEALCAVL